MIAITLKKTSFEVKASNKITLKEFLKLFGSKSKSELLLNILDKEVYNKLQIKNHDKGKEITNICKSVFKHIKILTDIYRKELNDTIGDESILTRYNKRQILKKLEELYSLSECNCIIGYAKKIALNPNNENLLSDKSIKALIMKEYFSYKKNNISNFNFPHGQILDHYEVITQWWNKLPLSESGFVSIKTFTTFLKDRGICSTT